MKIFIASVLILCSSVFISCASSGRHAGKLSDAMEKASDDHEGSRKVEAVRNVEPEEEDKEENFITFEKSEKTDDELKLKDIWLGISAGSGIMSTKSFYGVSSFSLHANTYIKGGRSLCFDLGGDYSPLQTTQSADYDPNEDPVANALDGGVLTLFAGLNARYYTTSQKTFLGNYFSAGIKVRSMFWSYKNPLIVAEYDENDVYLGSVTVTSDQIWGFDINCAAALNFMQTQHLIAGVELNPGVVIWGFGTREGFENDIFAPFFYLKTNFTLMMR
jgi:hypothetical protein